MKTRTTTHRCQHADRMQRQVSAEARRLARSARTDAEQLAILDTRPGVSARERARLA
jgi:hypothetical protein